MTQDRTPAKAQGVSEAMASFGLILNEVREAERSNTRNALIDYHARNFFVDHGEALQVALTASLSGAEAKPVAVKALEWQTDGETWWVRGNAPRYEVGPQMSWGCKLRFGTAVLGSPTGDWFISQTAAKAAAQKDHEERIRSALIDAPVPAATAQGVTEAERSHVGHAATAELAREIREANRLVGRLSLPATDTARPLNSGNTPILSALLRRGREYAKATCDEVVADNGETLTYQDSIVWCLCDALEGALAALSSAPSTPDGWEVAYTVRHTDGEFCASSTSLSDAQHYALVYGQDGPVEILEVRTRPLPTPPSGGSDA